MKKSKKATPQMTPETIPVAFTPSQEQIDALARRLMPEIKRYFADDRIQHEYAVWKERQWKDPDKSEATT